jgi:phage gpG-like protein
VEVGSSLEYAAVQQLGARRGQFGRTRRGAPIPWGDIPARPYLGISQADSSAILDIISQYLGARRA